MKDEKGNIVIIQCPRHYAEGYRDIDTLPYDETSLLYFEPAEVGRRKGKLSNEKE